MQIDSVDIRHYNGYMDDVQRVLGELKGKGWTLAAIGDALGIPPNTVRKWSAGLRHPANAPIVVDAMKRLADRKRVPKQRRYKKSPPG